MKRLLARRSAAEHDVGRKEAVVFATFPIGVERIGPGFAFSERSTMLSQRAWHHDRRVEPLGERACTVTDSIRFVPRLPALASLLRPVFLFTFRHRHRRLRRRFGGA